MLKDGNSNATITRSDYLHSTVHDYGGNSGQFSILDTVHCEVNSSRLVLDIGHYEEHSSKWAPVTELCEEVRNRSALACLHCEENTNNQILDIVRCEENGSKSNLGTDHKAGNCRKSLLDTVHYRNKSRKSVLSKHTIHSYENRFKTIPNSKDQDVKASGDHAGDSTVPTTPRQLPLVKKATKRRVDSCGLLLKCCPSLLQKSLANKLNENWAGDEKGQQLIQKYAKRHQPKLSLLSLCRRRQQNFHRSHHVTSSVRARKPFESLDKALVFSGVESGKSNDPYVVDSLTEGMVNNSADSYNDQWESSFTDPVHPSHPQEEPEDPEVGDPNEDDDPNQVSKNCSVRVAENHGTILLCYNVVFFLLGVAGISASVYLFAVGQNPFLKMNNPLQDTPVALVPSWTTARADDVLLIWITSFHAICLFLSFKFMLLGGLGLSTAYIQRKISKVFYVVYVVLLIVSMMTQVFTIGIIYTGSAQFHIRAQEQMNKSIKNRYNILAEYGFSVSMNIMMLNGQCCGVLGADDFITEYGNLSLVIPKTMPFKEPPEGLFWPSDGPLRFQLEVPPACCKLSIFNESDVKTRFYKVLDCARGLSNSSERHVEGCFKRLYHEFKEGYAKPVLLVLAFIVLNQGILLFVCLVRFFYLSDPESWSETLLHYMNYTEDMEHPENFEPDDYYGYVDNVEPPVGGDYQDPNNPVNLPEVQDQPDVSNEQQ